MQRCRIWSKYSGDTKLSSLTELEPGHDHVDTIHFSMSHLTEAKAHGALPPYPPSNLDRMDKNARNLNTKFKLAGKI
jgi:hypothetical protein